MEKQGFIFDRKNYILMLVGVLLIIVGYILMAGGGSDNPEVFNPEIFSARRIIVAPIIILAGLLIEIYAIMNTGNSKTNG
jgi:membrane-bound ClpP family serine protease